MEIIFLVSNIVACAFLMIYHMHMYQLNSYNIIEEKHWLQDNKYPNFGRIFGLFISIIFLVIFSFKFYIVGMILAILLNVATSLGNKEKESKISLKYTPRVKRMLLTSSIIYALYMIVIFVFI